MLWVKLPSGQQRAPDALLREVFAMFAMLLILLLVLLPMLQCRLQECSQVQQPQVLAGAAAH